MASASDRAVAAAEAGSRAIAPHGGTTPQLSTGSDSLQQRSAVDVPTLPQHAVKDGSPRAARGDGPTDASSRAQQQPTRAALPPRPVPKKPSPATKSVVEKELPAGAASVAATTRRPRSASASALPVTGSAPSLTGDSFLDASLARGLSATKGRNAALEGVNERSGRRSRSRSVAFPFLNSDVLDAAEPAVGEPHAAPTSGAAQLGESSASPHERGGSKGVHDDSRMIASPPRRVQQPPLSMVSAFTRRGINSGVHSPARRKVLEASAGVDDVPAEFPTETEGSSEEELPELESATAHWEPPGVSRRSRARSGGVGMASDVGGIVSPPARGRVKALHASTATAVAPGPGASAAAAQHDGSLDSPPLTPVSRRVTPRQMPNPLPPQNDVQSVMSDQVIGLSSGSDTSLASVATSPAVEARLRTPGSLSPSLLALLSPTALEVQGAATTAVQNASATVQTPSYTLKRVDEARAQASAGEVLIHRRAHRVGSPQTPDGGGVANAVGRMSRGSSGFDAELELLTDAELAPLRTPTTARRSYSHAAHQASGDRGTASPSGRVSSCGICALGTHSDGGSPDSSRRSSAALTPEHFRSHVQLRAGEAGSADSAKLTARSPSPRSKAREHVVVNALFGLGPRTPTPEPYGGAKFFFPSGVAVAELKDAADFPPQYQYTVTGRVRKVRREETAVGKRVVVNATTIALFKVRGELYAFGNSCPHMGAPLFLGDIEDVDGKTCVSCPHHGFKFDVASGEGVAPTTAGAMETFATRVRDDGVIEIGFHKIATPCFDDMDF